MKMPLLASSSVQNSALIWKSLFESLLTRYERSLPSSLSAASAPSFISQLALPTSVQSPFLLESSSVTQPSLWPDAVPENWIAAAAINEPAARVDRRFMDSPPVLNFWLRET